MTEAFNSSLFVSCFKKIRRRFGDQFEPSQLVEKLNSDTEFAALATMLFSFKFEIDRAIKSNPDKTLKQVHPEFPSEFAILSKAWAGFIPAYEDWKYPEHASNREALESYLEAVSPFITPPPFDDEGDYDLPPSGPVELDIDRYSAAHLVANLQSGLCTLIEGGDLHSRECESLDYLGLAALDWFEKRGFDFGKFEKRWNDLIGSFCTKRIDRNWLGEELGDAEEEAYA